MSIINSFIFLSEANCDLMHHLVSYAHHFPLLELKNEFLLLWMNWHLVWKDFIFIFTLKIFTTYPPKVTHTWNNTKNKKGSFFLYLIPSSPTFLKYPILIICYLCFHSFWNITTVSFYKNEMTLYTLLNALNISDILPEYTAYNSIHPF